SYDNTARIWDAATGLPLGDSLRHHSPVTSVAFAPDSSILATGCRDGSVQLWDTSLCQPLFDPWQQAGVVESIRFNSARNAIGVVAIENDASGHRRTAHIWLIPPMRIEAEPRHIRLWIETAIGQRLNAYGIPEIATADQWQATRDELTKIGNVPDGLQQLLEYRTRCWRMSEQ